MENIRQKDLPDVIDTLQPGDYASADELSSGQTKKFDIESIRKGLPEATIIEKGLFGSADKATLDNIAGKFDSNGKLLPEEIKEAGITPNKTSFIPIGKNKFNKSDIIADTYVSVDTGSVDSASGWATSNFIPVKPTQAYIISGSAVSLGNFAVAFYDVNKEFLSFDKNSWTFNTPADAAYLRMTVRDAAGDTLNILQLEEGSASTSYEAFIYVFETSNTLVIKAKSAEDSYTKAETDDKYPILETIYSKNLYNKNTYVIGYVHETDGSIAQADGSLVSRYIPVIPGGTYYLSGRSNMGTKGFRFLGADGTTLIKPLNADGTARANYTLADYNGIVKVPATAYYAQFTVAFSNSGLLDIIQFEAGNTATAFKAFGYEKRVPGDNLPGMFAKVDIQSSDKITIFGNSYTEGYPMLGKHYLSFLSMLSDYQFRNFAKSGDDMLEIMARIRTDEKRFGTIPVSEFGTTYGVIACRDNNSTLYSVNINTYYENAKKLAKEIEALGAKVILSTEHQAMYNALFESFHRLSNEYGYMFMNWGKFAQYCFGFYSATENVYFPPFWYMDHPSTRTQALWSENIRPYLETLPRPLQGIKIFRKRSSVVVLNIDTDLMFETLIQRAEKFQELHVGHLKLTPATEKYFDRIGSGVFEAQDDEYLKIQAGTAVTLADYALVECITPFTANSLENFKLFLATTNLSKVFVKKTLGLSSYPEYPADAGSAYYSTFENPLGEWFELVKNPDGYYELPEGMFRQAITYDKLSFLLQSTGTPITISDIYFTCSGEKYKNRESGKKYEIKAGTELLSSILLDSGWTETGTPSTYVRVADPSDATVKEVLPYGVTTVREVDNANYISQALSNQPVKYRDYDIQVRILCRYFPLYVDNDTKWATSVIKGDSFDLAGLDVQITCDGNAPVKLGSSHVNLYWHEIVLNGSLANNNYNSIIIKSKDSKKIQVAKVEVILV